MPDGGTITCGHVSDAPCRHVPLAVTLHSLTVLSIGGHVDVMYVWVHLSSCSPLLAPHHARSSAASQRRLVMAASWSHTLGNGGGTAGGMHGG